ncbi:MAG: hypothetical protein RL071_1778 [Pseudomonadota bacterium]
MPSAPAVFSRLPLLAAALLGGLSVAHAERLGPVTAYIDCVTYDKQHGEGACEAMCKEDNEVMFAMPHTPGWHLVDITCKMEGGTAVYTRWYRKYDGGFDDYEHARIIPGHGGGVEVGEGGGVLQIRGAAEIIVVIDDTEGGRSETYVSAEGGELVVAAGDLVWLAFADPLAEGEITVELR